MMCILVLKCNLGKYPNNFSVLESYTQLQLERDFQGPCVDLKNFVFKEYWGLDCDSY